MSQSPINIRQATPQDAQAIADFNSLMAMETEGKTLQPDTIFSGVTNMIANPAYGYYLVAEQDGQVVGSLMVTSEWSDWRDGLFWWIQSVYIRKEWRRQGIYRKLYDMVKTLAAENGNICGYRLYVEKDNLKAQQTYQSLGMTETDYFIYEAMTES
uniref:Protein export cytoplasm protein SecA ATPase RNA helicase (TC 3.A.5.1.1) n=1 Tax=uncultured Thiotrichaceae bacterium TaxID=298394 RepID=A0A6S6UHH7_9GAMM|nr:MAG: Protein export cytoplasm protein SecA ATPase RNA helicase (TC 3.A.5.1.1) [uncultured Thiotrichaceae bacterium]